MIWMTSVSLPLHDDLDVTVVLHSDAYGDVIVGRIIEAYDNEQQRDLTREEIDALADTIATFLTERRLIEMRTAYSEYLADLLPF